MVAGVLVGLAARAATGMAGRAAAGAVAGQAEKAAVGAAFKNMGSVGQAAYSAYSHNRSSGPVVSGSSFPGAGAHSNYRVAANDNLSDGLTGMSKRLDALIAINTSMQAMMGEELALARRQASSDALSQKREDIKGSWLSNQVTSVGSTFAKAARSVESIVKDMAIAAGLVGVASIAGGEARDIMAGDRRPRDPVTKLPRSSFSTGKIGAPEPSRPLRSSDDASATPVKPASATPVKPASSATPVKPASATPVNYDGLGSVAAKFESGRGGRGEGYGTVSTGRGDAGGISYGRHQFSSKVPTGGPGTVFEFIRTSGYGDRFKGLTPGSEAFGTRWKELATRDPKFNEAQDAFIHKEYNTLVAALRRKGYDFSKRGPAIQEMIYSISVQYGKNATWVITRVMTASEAQSLSEAEIIKRVFAAKVANVRSDFKSSPKLQPSLLANRFPQERSALLQLASVQSDPAFSPTSRITPASSGSVSMSQMQSAVGKQPSDGAAVSSSSEATSPSPQQATPTMSLQGKIKDYFTEELKTKWRKTSVASFEKRGIGDESLRNRLFEEYWKQAIQWMMRWRGTSSIDVALKGFNQWWFQKPVGGYTTYAQPLIDKWNLEHRVQPTAADPAQLEPPMVGPDATRVQSGTGSADNPYILGSADRGAQLDSMRKGSYYVGADGRVHQNLNGSPGNPAGEDIPRRNGRTLTGAAPLVFNPGMGAARSVGLEFDPADRSMGVNPIGSQSSKGPTPPTVVVAGGGNTPVMPRSTNMLGPNDVPNPSAANIIREYQLYFTSQASIAA